MPLASDIDKQKYRLSHPVVSNDVKNAKKNVTLLNSVFKKLKNNLFPYRDTVFSLNKDGTILSGFDYIGDVNKILLRFDISVKYKRNLISIDYIPYIIENGNQRYYSEISSEITSDDFEMGNGKEPDIFLSQGDMTDKEYKDFLKEDFTLFSNSILSIVESKYKETIKLVNKVESNMRELKRNMKVENMRKEFDDFIYYLIELLNHTFSRKGGWFLSDNKFNRLGATIEHENGVQFELYDEEVNKSSDVTLIVEYPNGKSKWLGAFWQKDLTDIADKMYEYAVVRNRNESRRKLEMGINKVGRN